MIELSQLQQLVAFADAGTLTAAAHTLHISQPSLTRTMQRLEEEFRVPLFTHRKNKLVLNENGLLAVSLARQVLRQSAGMLAEVRAADRSRRTVFVGSCAPAPLWEISPQLAHYCPQKTIASELKTDTELLLTGLAEDVYQLIVLPFPVEDEHLLCVRWGTENLMLSLPETHRLAAKAAGVYLAEMDGETMLLYSELGFWRDMPAQKMPHSRFLLQSDRYTFNELVQASNLPCFTSDVVLRTPEQHGQTTGRVNIPILDEEAHATYYCCAKKKGQEDLRGFLRQLT